MGLSGITRLLEMVGVGENRGGGRGGFLKGLIWTLPPAPETKTPYKLSSQWGRGAPSPTLPNLDGLSVTFSTNKHNKYLKYTPPPPLPPLTRSQFPPLVCFINVK